MDRSNSRLAGWQGSTRITGGPRISQRSRIRSRIPDHKVHQNPQRWLQHGGFAAAKKLGIDVLVAEPETHGKMEKLPGVMDVVEKMAREYNIKVAIHNHPGPQGFYWKTETLLAAAP